MSGCDKRRASLPAGFEPATLRLTATRSTNWAIGEARSHTPRHFKHNHAQTKTKTTTQPQLCRTHYLLIHTITRAPVEDHSSLLSFTVFRRVDYCTLPCFSLLSYSGIWSFLIVSYFRFGFSFCIFVLVFRFVSSYWLFVLAFRLEFSFWPFVLYFRFAVSFRPLVLDCRFVFSFRPLVLDSRCSSRLFAFNAGLASYSSNTLVHHRRGIGCKLQYSGLTPGYVVLPFWIVRRMVLWPIL